MREEWVESSLGEVCTINMGQSPPSSTYNTEKIGLPFFQGKAEFTQLYPIAEKWCSKPKKIANAGDILLSVRAPVGSTNLANQKCAIGRGLAAISYQFSIQFIWFYLKLIEKRLDSQGTGTTFRAISGAVLKTQNLPLPPLPEQRAIVAKIEELFANLDQGIADLKKAQDQLKIYRQAVLKKAFEGKLSGTGLTRLKDGQDSKSHENQAHHKNHGSDKGELPEGWKWVRLDDISEHITDGDHQAPPKAKEGIPFITISNIEKSSNKIDFINTFFVGEEYFKALNKKRVPKKGDILYTVTGSFGIPVIVDFDKDFCFQRHIGLIRPLPDVSQKWLFYLLQSNLVYSQASSKATGTAQKTVALSTLRNITVPYSPQIEQHQIVREIESRLSVCDQVEQSITESLEKAKALRQSILKKAFEGTLLTAEEIAKCKQEKDWEPAEKLLERIKREKMK